MKVKSLITVVGLAFVSACSQASLTPEDNEHEFDTYISDLKHQSSSHGKGSSHGAASHPGKDKDKGGHGKDKGKGKGKGGHGGGGHGGGHDGHAGGGHGGHAGGGHGHACSEHGGGHHHPPDPDDVEDVDDNDTGGDGHGGHDGHGGNQGNVPEELRTPWPTKNKHAMETRVQRVREIYENLVYPTPISILKDEKTMTHVFEERVVRGRVNPVGEFLEFASVLEYFYALAITPGSIVQNVKFKSLFAGEDKVAVEVDIYFCRAPFENCDPNVPVSENAHTLTQVGFFQFNRYDRVISLDLNILNLGMASDLPDIPEVRAEAIAQICTALTIAHISPITGAVVYSGTCTSSFDSADDFAPDFPVSDNPFQNCVAFMQSIPFGTWDRGHSNTVVCRQLHSLLTPVDPDMHCPHTSPGGGGKCVDITYADYYTQDF